MPSLPIIIATTAALALFAIGRSDRKTSSSKPARKRRGRITSSTRDPFDTVRESPRQLLAQARKRADPDVSLNELTAARLIASEHASGSRVEMAAIVEAEWNRARSKRKTLTAHLTSAGTYGKQGGRHGKGKRRPASTRRDPTHKHLDVARAVLGGQLRGITHGAVTFFDPVSQWSSHQKWLAGKSKRRHCHPALILKVWSHDLRWDKDGPPCTPRGKPGRHLLKWVGPIDGIDPMRLMLLRPAKAGEEHKRRYQQALRLILERYPLPTPEPEETSP